MLDRVPPSDMTAERAVLGSLILAPQIVDEVVGSVSAEDFYDDAHRKMFQSIVRLIYNKGRVDTKLLIDQLTRDGVLDEIGGLAAVASIVTAVPNAANAMYYSRIVRDYAIRRGMIATATSTIAAAFDLQTDASDSLSDTERSLFGLVERSSVETVIPIRSVLVDAMERIDRRRSSGGEDLDVVPTGFESLDSMMVGLPCGGLVILAARPGMGKSALAMNIAANVAAAGKSVLAFSLEMGNMELADRLMSAQSGVNGRHMRDGTLTQDERLKLVDVGNQIAGWNLSLLDDTSVSIRKLMAHSRKAKRSKQGLDLLVIDYLQLVEPDNPRDIREQQIALMTRSLKRLARELNIPILCLAQLNRKSEAEGKNNRPRMSHLRESGAIEQDADVIMFVHREEEAHKGDVAWRESHPDSIGRAEVIIEKQRNGPTGTVELCWERECTRFSEVAKRISDFDDWNDSQADRKDVFG